MKKRNFSPFPQRSPVKPTAHLPRQLGFTLIEVMLSLVLVAIGAALSLPSYREMVEKRQLTNGAEQIMAFVNSTQMEAMKRNRFITVSYSRTADNNWCFGAILGASAQPDPDSDEGEGCDCNETTATETDFCAINSTPAVINSGNTGNLDLLKSITGDGHYSFDPIRGIVFPKIDGSNDSLLVEMSSSSQKYQLNLTVSNTGQAILCSKDSSHKVPGYNVCPGTSS
jgi:prepilin-type N-terminal cleavage/methylation domain-containing protein